MNRWTVFSAGVIVIMLVALGCSSGGAGPVSPTTTPSLTAESVNPGQPQTHLWGFYECWLDQDTMTIEHSVDRTTMFTANVVGFVNKPPSNLQFDIVRAEPDGTNENIEVDINVGITHPFPGLSEYDGYDVRGIFIGDEDSSLQYNTDLKYGSDQMQHMLNDPYEDDGGGPDGYTRWWNPDEFITPGVLGYEPGAFATSGYTGTATLNPYKYFADGLGSHDDAFEFLTTTTDNGVFTAGSTNERNYFLKFPMAVGVNFNYAIAASWIDETTHPANGPEAMAASITMTDDIWNDGAGSSGGDLEFEVSVQGWHGQPSTIYVESNVLTTVNTITAPPTGGGATYSTYEFDVPADGTIPDEGWNGDLWVICEYGASDYSNEYGVPNNADGPLASFFRKNFYIANEPYNQAPVCDMTVVDTMPFTGYGEACIEFDATGSYDPDGSIVAWEWDFDGDGVFGDAYDSGTDDNPTYCYDADYVGEVCLRLIDDLDKISECCVDVDITVLPLYSEDFTTDPGDWCLQTYQYWSGCTQGLPCWRNTPPYGQAAGSLQTPCTGNYLWGGALQTHVSPSFFMPSSSSGVTFRCRAMWDLGGSYDYYTKTNFAIANSTASGCTPFSTTSCAGGTIMMSTAAHGGATPTGWVSSGGSGPCAAYAGWRGSFNPIYPSNIPNYLDLDVPAANQGTDVKVAFRCHPDWCYYPGSNAGIILDDVEIMVW